MGKRRTLRERFEESYVAVSVPARNKKGYKKQYVYCAPWYFWDMPLERLYREKGLLLASSVLSFVIFVMAAAQRTELNSWAGVYLPAMLALCAHILELCGVLQFCAAKQPTTKMTYQEIHRLLGFAPVARAICTSLTGVMALIRILAGSGSPLALGVTVLFFACTGIVCFEISRYSKISVRMEKNTAWDDLEPVTEL